jgi:hypothetical protein
MKLTFATFILKKVLFSCERIWMSSGGGPDPLDPPLIYATGVASIILTATMKKGS